MNSAVPTVMRTMKKEHKQKLKDEKQKHEQKLMRMQKEHEQHMKDEKQKHEQRMEYEKMRMRDEERKALFEEMMKKLETMPTEAEINAAPYLCYVKEFKRISCVSAIQMIIWGMVSDRDLSPEDMKSLCAYLGLQEVLQEVLQELKKRDL